MKRYRIVQHYSNVGYTIEEETKNLWWKDWQQVYIPTQNTDGKYRDSEIYFPTVENAEDWLKNRHKSRIVKIIEVNPTQ